MAKAGKKAKKAETPTIENRKARFEYHISETLEVGIVLIGPEVKSVRDGQVSIGEGYVRATAEPPSLTLDDVMIAEYPPAGGHQHTPTRTRRLLAHKREIVRLAKAAQVKGMTIVPLKLYFKNGYAKLLVGVAQGKSRQDKRETIAKRESQRDIDRAMSRRVG